jgi:hypothetical protein
MIHKIKCPACKGEFDLDIDDPPAVEGEMQALAITKCQNCGIPLVNFDGVDNWEVLKPSDIHKLPKDLQVHIAQLLLGSEEIANLKEAMEQGDIKITPMDRARIFLPKSTVNSEGCIVLFGPKDWGMFAVLSNMRKRPQMRDAMHHIATKQTGQVVEDN